MSILLLAVNVLRGFLDLSKSHVVMWDLSNVSFFIFSVGYIKNIALALELFSSILVSSPKFSPDLLNFIKFPSFKFHLC